MQVLFPLVGHKPMLARWEQQPFHPGVDQGPLLADSQDVYERAIAVEAPGAPEPDGPFRRVARAIREYRIFPPTLVTGVLRRTPVEPGDTVGICYHLAWGVDLFFAARVVACFDELLGNTWKAGFVYRTLQGHPELGEETFSVEKDVATGRVVAALRSWSRPGLWIARAAYPYTRFSQSRASRGALRHLAGLAVETGAPALLG